MIFLLFSYDKAWVQAKRMGKEWWYVQENHNVNKIEYDQKYTNTLKYIYYWLDWCVWSEYFKSSYLYVLSFYVQRFW